MVVGGCRGQTPSLALAQMRLRAEQSLSINKRPSFYLQVGLFSALCFPFEVTHDPVHGGETILSLPGSNQFPGSLSMMVSHGDGRRLT